MTMKGITFNLRTLLALTALAALAAFSLYGYRPANADHEIVGSPSDDRIKVKAAIETLYFEESVRQADLIAEVTIAEKLYEVNEPSPKTVYSAAMNQLLKGKADANLGIRIMQQGNSRYSFNDNPMFQAGDTYLLFLKKAVGMEDDHTYWILGEETSIYEQWDDDRLVKWSLKDSRLAELTPTETNAGLQAAAESVQKKHPGKEIQVLDRTKFKATIAKELKRS